MAHAETSSRAPADLRTASLAVLNTRPELEIRPRRASNTVAEHRALAAWAAEMAATLDTRLPQSRHETDAGLGLVLLERRMHLHGGVVSVVSDGPDRGSGFTVRLPIGSARIADRALQCSTSS